MDDEFSTFRLAPEAALDERLYHGTFFAASLDLFVVRDQSYNIVKVNPAWERLMGYPAHEMEGRSMLSFIHPDDLAATRTRMRRIEAEREISYFTNRYRRKDGGYRHLEWRARQVGALVYGVARDVTARIQLEAEMERAKEEALAANRAKSDFLANMSHEIRTPLNGVIAVASVLARTDLSDVQREMVDLILTSGATLERVVSDVLDVSKIEAGRLKIEAAPFDLRAEIQGLVSAFRPKAQEKNLALNLELGARVKGEHVGDAVRIKQILGNLVSNAIKFTDRGWVRVAADVLDGGDDATSDLVLEVQDTGIGFDEAFAGALFQRFSQADGSITRRFGGSGLGLSICRALTQMMGGEITAVSTPGEGSAFRVRLPLSRLASGDAADVSPPSSYASSPLAPHEAEEGARDGGLKILLAEDHAINRRVIEMILKPIGVSLTTVEDGAQALRAYQDAPFDLILMDMQMPVMDGLAATRAIRAHELERPGRPRTPIIMVSANAMRQHSEEARAAGADLHLAKPVTPTRLLQAVSAIVEGACARTVGLEP